MDLVNLFKDLHEEDPKADPPVEISKTIKKTVKILFAEKELDFATGKDWLDTLGHILENSVVKHMVRLPEDYNSKIVEHFFSFEEEVESAIAPPFASLRAPKLQRM